MKAALFVWAGRIKPVLVCARHILIYKVAEGKTTRRCKELRLDELP